MPSTHPPAMVHVPSSRRAVLSAPPPAQDAPTIRLLPPPDPPRPVPVAPTLLAVATTNPERAGELSESLADALVQSLAGRILGGVLCSGTLAALTSVMVLLGKATPTPGRLAAACAFVLLAWPLLGLLGSMARVACTHALLSALGGSRAPLPESLRAGLLGSSLACAFAWMPGPGAAVCLLWECRALAGLHRQGLVETLGASLISLGLSMLASAASGALCALLWA